MKVGVRTPSLKKSFKARTTGKIKRKVKKTVNPLYGKKGMGFIKNPKRAVYNKIYRKTTVSPFKLFDGFVGIILGICILPFWLMYYIAKGCISIISRIFNPIKQKKPVSAQVDSIDQQTQSED